MTFGFLPPHGKLLADDEEYTVFGNILEAVNRGNRIAARRNQKALESALDSGLLKIVETPAAIIIDADSSESRMVKIDAGTLSSVSPCWENAI